MTEWELLTAPVADSETFAGEFVALLAMLTLPVTAPAAAGVKATVSAAVCAGVSVRPAAAPLLLNPAPETTTLESVTFEFPVFVKVTFSELLLFTFTLPKLRLVGLTPNRTDAATPAPLSGSVSVGFEALLTMEIEPDSLATTVGANAALNVALPPAAIVRGTVSPEILNPVPVTAAFEIVTLLLPVLLMRMDCVFVCPVTTFPKLTLDGVAASEPDDPVPLPLKLIVNRGSNALLVTAMLPVAVPAAVGAKRALKVKLLPAAIVKGATRPLSLKPVPLTATFEMVKLVVP